MPDSTNITIKPLTIDLWGDLEELFGKHGASGGCWCMWWRLNRVEYIKHKGDGNRKALNAITAAGKIPGIIAYDGDTPVGWCSVAPREQFPRLDALPLLKKVDETPVWSVVCFFITRSHRKTGISEKLLLAAVEYVRQQGGLIVEGYPHEIDHEKKPDPSLYTGLYSVFLKAGFKEVVRRSESRPIMRFQIRP